MLPASHVLTAKSGEGGVGTVWKARDPRLDRTVALKVSKSNFTDRFEREARAVAALNHPHICQLYDIGPNYLVMEFVDGAPLKGPLPLEKAVEYAGQILDALEAAHKKGITHRDLKPANILLTKQGIKLLDFGLAKRVEAAGPDGATMTAITAEGHIAGTLQYMSPEQLQGKDVDPRSDLFSFGCVLYEMLSGKRAFAGESTASVIAAIMEREPAPLELGAPLARVLRTCLAKDPERRFQSAIDLKRDLLWAMEERPATAAATEKSRVPVWAIGLPVLLAAALGWSLWRSPTKSVTPPSAITRITRDGRSTSPALSPDGKLLAFSSAREGENQDIYVQQTGSSPIRLTDDPAADRDPAFSADGTKIYFSSDRTPPGIYEVPALGGDARLLVPDARIPRPSPKGTHLAYLVGEQWYLDTIPPAAAPNKPLNIGNSFQSPVWSPEGERLMIRERTGGQDFGIISLTGAPLQSVPLAANLNRRRLTQQVILNVVKWLPNDDLLIASAHGDAKNLWRIPLSEAASGIPAAVTVGNSTIYTADSSGGRIIFAASTGTVTLWSLPCDLNSGRVLGPPKKLLPGQVDGSHPDITQDGTQLIYCSRRNGSQGIWSLDLRTGKDRLVAAFNTIGDAYSHTVISPDGQQVAAMAQDPKSHWLELMRAAGGPSKRIHTQGARLRGFTPDGKSLLLWAMPHLGEKVELLDIATGDRTRILSRGEDVFREPRLSPDGQWLAFVDSNGNLYVAPFRGRQPIPPATWIEIASGVTQPAWSPDGQSLYYRLGRFSIVTAPNVTLMRQPLDAGTRRPVGTPTVFHRFGDLLFVNSVVNPIAVARDQIILSMTEPTSDLWSIDLPPR